MSLITIRPVTPGDNNYVSKTAFESFMRNLDLGTIPFEVFAVGARHRLDRLLARSHVFVACATAYPTEILGWSAIDNASGCVHGVYVRNTFRRQGIGTQLLTPAPRPLIITCPTKHHEAQGFFESLKASYDSSLADPPKKK